MISCCLHVLLSLLALSSTAAHGTVSNPAPRQRGDHYYCPWCIGEQSVNNRFGEVNHSTVPSSPCLGTSSNDQPYRLIQWGSRKRPYAGTFSRPTYAAGAPIDTTIVIDSDHNGDAIWEVCSTADGAAETETCFARSPLTAHTDIHSFFPGHIPCDASNYEDPRCDHWQDESHYTQRVALPRTLPVGPAVLRWTWRTRFSSEIFLACIDIDVAASFSSFSSTAPPSPSLPTDTPAVALPTPAPAPVPAPAPAAAVPPAGYCNWNGCNGATEGGDWCNADASRCTGGCGGTWCTGGGGADVGVNPTPTPPTPVPPTPVPPTPTPPTPSSTLAPALPTPTPPTPAPAPPTGSAGYCNWNGCNGEVEGGAWCNEDSGQCTGGCGGTWCDSVGGGGGISPAPTPPTPSSPTPPTPPTPAPATPTPPSTGGGDGGGGNTGYCNWNGCDGTVQGGAWCNADAGQCVGCGGGAQWCTGTTGGGNTGGGDGDTGGDTGNGGSTNNGNNGNNGSTCALPASLPASASPVDNTGFATAHGKLRVDGVQLVDASGAPVQLTGMSSHGLHWFPSCYTRASVAHLVQSWGVNVFRAAMYVGEGGYATDPATNRARVEEVVRWCKELGVYVIIDWHVLSPGDPNDPGTYGGAEEFWVDMAAQYRGEAHVLYELANEPNGIDWPSVKRYHERIITAVRAVDPDTVVLCGTTTWSQDIHLAAADPISHSLSTNVMYAFHFYAGTHASLLSRVRQYRSAIPLFCTEWGTSEASGNHGPFLDTSLDFLELFRDAGGTGGQLISWAQWSYADKAETSAALAPGACGRGEWDDTSCSGSFLRAYIRTHASTAPAAGAAVWTTAFDGRAGASPVDQAEEETQSLWDSLSTATTAPASLAWGEGQGSSGGSGAEGGGSGSWDWGNSWLWSRRGLRGH